MTKKIVGLALASLLCLVTVSTGVWAYFSDTEASANTRLTSGTLDLKTNNANGVTQSLYTTSLKPNVSVGPATITLRNAGTLNGSTLSIAFAYTESDGSPNTINKTADETAAVIEVTTLTYDGTNLLASVSDANATGYKDMWDLKNASLTGLSGLAAGANKDCVVTIKMRDGISNDFQADGISITMTFTLNQ